MLDPHVQGRIALDLLPPGSRAYLVNRGVVLNLVQDALLHVVDNKLAFRDGHQVEDWYRAAWFTKRAAPVWELTPPAAYFQNGRLHFFNGRHRLILLSRYLDTFPLVIGIVRSPDHAYWCSANQDSLARLSTQEMSAGDTFALPSLPVRDKPEH